MTKRIDIADFLTSYPDAFWIFMHVSWGAIYGSIVLAVAFVGYTSHLYLKKNPKSKWSLLFFQLVWALLQLTGVFGVPWLLALANKEVFIAGNYFAYFGISFFFTVGLYCWFFTRVSSFKVLNEK
jgi:hypothetical protein